MNTLVTGAAGFIGSNFIKQWSQLGHHSYIIDNLTSGFRINLPKNIHFIKGDIRDKNLFNNLKFDIDIIYNFAASVGNKRSIENPSNDLDINSIGLIRILEYARKNDISKIVHSSSAAVFGELKYLPIDENHPTNPLTPYGISKLTGERYCNYFEKTYGLKIVALRYFNVYGPNQRLDPYGNVIPIFINNVLKNRPIIIFGKGNQTRDFISVQDVVQANIKSGLKNNLRGIFNIGTGKKVKINHLVNIIQRIIKRKIKIIYTNPRHGDVLHSVANIEKAKTKFSFHPVIDLNEGLTEYIQWYSSF